MNNKKCTSCSYNGGMLIQMKSREGKESCFRILQEDDEIILSLDHVGGAFCPVTVDVLTINIYRVHIDAIGVRPRVLKVLLQPLPQWVGNLVKPDELFHSQHLSMITGRARV